MAPNGTMLNIVDDVVAARMKVLINRLGTDELWSLLREWGVAGLPESSPTQFLMAHGVDRSNAGSVTRAGEPGEAVSSKVYVLAVQWMAQFLEREGVTDGSKQ